MTKEKLSQNLYENNSPGNALTISQLSRDIKKSLENNFPDKVWIRGEINEFRIHTSGHAYLELVEKDSKSDSIKARIKATIWAFKFRMLRPYFEASTGFQMGTGINILVEVNIDYHPQYSMSVNIHDIDPSYTLGDLAMKKAEILERLEKEGVINMNKSLPFPIVPQRIAIITSETAAGYGDFIDSLEKNPYRFHFSITLFPSAMQGDKAVQSIISSLEDIYKIEDQFDLVILIRGGGATTDLECFNNYDLALHLSQFPLPIITGIGHERDDTVCDFVAFQKLKTPTAVAEFLIDQLLDFYNRLETSRINIIRRVQGQLDHQNLILKTFSSKLSVLTNSALATNKNNINLYSVNINSLIDKSLSIKRNKLDETKRRILRLGFNFLNDKIKVNNHLHQKLNSSIKRYIENEKNRLEQINKIKDLLDPQHTLKRGYSITYHNGKLLKTVNNLKTEDLIETILSKGKLVSKITKKSK